MEIIVVPATTLEEGAKGLLPAKLSAPVRLNTELLRANLGAFIEGMNELLQALPKLAEPYKLEGIDIVVEINAEGSLQLVGGVKVGASGGLTLKFKR